MIQNCSDKISEIVSKLDKKSKYFYQTVYAKYLTRYLNRKGNLLEIGVDRGDSSILWHELLPKFNMCIVDPNNCLDQQNSVMMNPSRVQYIITDAYKEDFRDSLKDVYGKFDFITDDGPHTLESQIKCIDLYLPLLKKDGVMIIEHVGYENLEFIINHLGINHPKLSYEVFDHRHIDNANNHIAIAIGSSAVIKKRNRIVMTTMFKNESRVMRRMLESCAPYIDYWVIQNNGSTDGTDKIVNEFFEEYGIPGVLYNVEEGWVGFGWNRDHLTKTCQSIDHGCDWILKMDCDEVLEVDDDFDWTPLTDESTHAFHIAAVSGSCIYYRAWMWNARMPWRFNHDPCHETIYCEIPEIGSNYIPKDLPPSFRQIGYNEGESWSVPTKYMSDALILEEKMIREGTMLTQPYHFWYIGKSYSDCFKSEHFPLKENHQREYARRCIFYLEEYVNHMHKLRTTKQAQYIDEMSYMALYFAADAYRFLGETHAAKVTLELSEQFAPGRNDHLFALAELMQSIEDYESMLKYTSKMMQPERTNAFPNYVSFIDTSIYHDSPTQKVQNLHQIALDRSKKKEIEPPRHESEMNFYINSDRNKKFFVVDNFYSNPDEIRNFALTQVEYKEDLRWYKGLRSTRTYIAPGTKEAFESIIGEKISFEDDGGYNGVFQIMLSKDPQVYHYDMQKWAAMIYLSPNAPLESGTRLHRSKINGTRHSSERDVDLAFNGDFYDSTKFDIVDSAGNVYNRLVIMDAQCIHSAGSYFGNTPETGRLTHLFFFN